MQRAPNGRIFLAMNAKLNQITTIASSAQHITAKVQNEVGLHYALKVVYGENIATQRDRPWQEIVHIRSNLHGRP